MAAQTTPESLRATGHPIWFWLSQHSQNQTLDESALMSLLGSPVLANADITLDGFIKFLKTEIPHGRFCISPSCPGCPHSGQDVLLFVHKLSTFLRNTQPPENPHPELVRKLVSFSRECRAVLGTTVNMIAQSFPDRWRFLSFDDWKGTNEKLMNRKNYYRIFTRICKPLLISLARLFFTLFRGFIKSQSRDPAIFKQCVEELLMIKNSYADLGASSLYEFSLIERDSRVELGLPESSSCMHALQSRSSTAFDRVRMPDEIFESALEVFLSGRNDRNDPQALASEIQDAAHISILRGMGFRRDVLGCLTALCTDNCDDNAFELITQISSVPLSFRDESGTPALLNLDDARAFRGEMGSSFPITTRGLISESEQSDTALHARFLSVCMQKLQFCLQTPDVVADLLDFSKALRSVVSLVSDSSSSTFLRLCFESPGQQDSVFRLCVSLAQFCINRAAPDASGTNHAAAAFVLMSIVVSIVQKQKQGAAAAPQISKDREEDFPALSLLSDVGKFHSALSTVEKDSACRFVSSWLLACDGQFFALFRKHNDILTRLVPLSEGRLLREIVRFVRREAFQQYIPSACFSWLSTHPTFSKQFVAIFSTLQGQKMVLDRTIIPQCISPFPSPFAEQTDRGGQLVMALFSSDESKQEAAASIISNVITSDSETHIQLIGSVLHRIKSGHNAAGCLTAIKHLLPVMEHPGLHGVLNPQGGIQGGWHSNDGFFMTLLHGRTRESPEKTEFLQSLSVLDLLISLERPGQALDPAAKASHINAIFANLILVSRGITKSQSMWRLENPDKSGMISLMFPSVAVVDALSNLVSRLFTVLAQVEESPHLLFSLPEMISVAAALLSSRNFALRRPLFANDVSRCMSCILPLLRRVETDDDAANIAKSIFSIISPEFYVACMDNARSFEYFWNSFLDKREQEKIHGMRKNVADSFFSTLSALKELTQANAAVATRVIRLYFDCLKSMFTYYRSVPIRSSSLTKYLRPSVFQCEVWPKPNEQNIKFSTEDVESVLNILSSRETFQALWSSAMALQDGLKASDAMSCRLSFLQPMHQVAAHAVNFVAFKIASAVQDSYSQLQQLCNILVPSRIDQKQWLMALPVLREILLQQTSFLSSASSMFLGVPVLVDGHLFAATHMPYVMGKLKEHAGLIASGSYDDHPLFVFGSDDGHDFSPTYSPQMCNAAILSIFTGMAFDFLGDRSPFLKWLHRLFSRDPSLGTTLQEGARVRIQGLQAEPRLNGRVGVLGLFQQDAGHKFFGRWKVEIVPEHSAVGETGNFKPANLVLDDSFPDFSSQLPTDLAADILGQLPASKPQDSPTLWDDLQCLGHLEYELYFRLHEQGSARFSRSILTSCSKVIEIMSGRMPPYPPPAQLKRDIFQSLSRNTQSPQTADFQTKCMRYLQPLLDLDQHHNQTGASRVSEDEVRHKVQEFQCKLQKLSSDPLWPAQARCHMLGSLFRIAASGIRFKISCAEVDPDVLVTLCKSYCKWFAQTELDQYDTIDRSSDTNTFPRVVTVGLETIRAAVHCLMLLPKSENNLTEALGSLAPLLTDSHKELIDVVVSTIAKPSNCLPSPALQEGSLVRVHGLTSEKAAEMNGQIGVIYGPFDPITGRWPVNVRMPDDSQKAAALRTNTIRLISDHLTADNVLQLLSSIILNRGETTTAFKVVLERPPLYLKICNWLMMNNHDSACSQLLIRLVSEQNFPKVFDASLPRSSVTGLVNLGNTCFISSLFQQLASIPKYVAALRSPVFGPEGQRLVAMDQSKTRVLKELLGKLCNQRACLDKDATVGYFRKLGFTLDGKQDDPLAVLRAMNGWLVAETSDYDHNVHGTFEMMRQTENDSDVLSRTLVASMQKHVSWLPDCTCATQSSQIESVFEGLITLKAHASGIQSMKSIEEVLTARLIDREDKEQCGCRQGQSPCKVTLQFVDKLPQVLVLGLNARAEYVGSNSSQVKDRRVPSLSKELDLSKCAKLGGSVAQGNTVYVLNGIIMHHGTEVFAGHYTSLVRRADSTWVHIDDDQTHGVDAHEMDVILQRDGKELPAVDGFTPTYMTGKPCALFYVLKSVSHPCSSVLFDDRLVKCMAAAADASPPESVSTDSISLCFKLAPLFAHEQDRSRSIARICSRFLAHSEGALVGHFHRLASSEDPELLFAMCNIDSDAAVGGDKILSKELAISLAVDAPHFSSRALHRRVTAAFEIGRQLPPDSQKEICGSVCSMLYRLLPSAADFAVGAGEKLFPTKAYAALKSISDLRDDSPFLQFAAQDENFVSAVRHLSDITESLPVAAADQKTNLLDDDQDCVVALSRTATASSAIEKLRDLMQDPAVAGSPRSHPSNL